MGSIRPTESSILLVCDNPNLFLDSNLFLDLNFSKSTPGETIYILFSDF